MKKLTAIGVGFGGRCATYCGYANKHPDELEIVAAADPNPARLRTAHEKYGVPEDQLRKAAALSVCKINIDSDLRLAMTGTIRKFFNDEPSKFDPREYLKPARANIKEIVRHKLINVLGCAGKA
jgi:fructose/tagatose bisphosphate aldolase